MKLHRILFTSVLLNMALIGLVGYLWGSKVSPRPSEAVSRPTSFQESPVVTPAPGNVPRPQSVAISPTIAPTTIPPTNSLLAVAAPRPGNQIPTFDDRRTASSSSPFPPGVASQPSASNVESTSTTPSSVSQMAPDQPVNSSRPGNTLLFHGIQASVSEAISTNGTTAAPALGVDFSPTNSPANGAASPADEAPTSASSGAGAAVQSNGTGSAVEATPATNGTATTKRNRTSTASGTPTSTDPSSSANGASPTGLTTEEQLFRMRWGWAAYDAARLAALKQAGQ